MTVKVVVGTQWGDEGKGRIIDWLAQDAQLVIRFQGGDNAGHTVINQYGTFKLRLMPSGIFNQNCHCLLSSGTVVNPEMLQKECLDLEKQKINTKNLRVSARAQLVFPWHLTLDRLEEEARGSLKVGTTMRGIGPAYADKVRRIGIRIGDLFDENNLQERLHKALEHNNRAIKSLNASESLFEYTQVFAMCQKWAEFLVGKVVDDLEFITPFLENKSNILLEGQLGIMRDIDWGLYPFCTSSSPTAAGACMSTGIPPRQLDEVIGVAKAYTTVVGTGPFVTELHSDNGTILRERGLEYGAATGRPRRCGWFDAVAVRFAVRVNGINSLMLTKLDILSGFKKLQICTAWTDGEREYLLPPSAYAWKQMTPVYTEMEGWTEEINNCKSFVELPVAAQKYVKFLSEVSNCPIDYVSVGPERAQLFPVHV